MHLADIPLHFWGGYAIVGGHVPLATGLGLAIRYKEENRAVLAVMGEGSTNIGYFHESINMAALWKLPVVYLVENNQYGMGTDVTRASAVSDIFERGCAYNIASRRINGQDVNEVYPAVQEALEHARKEGPYLLEVLTYRYAGHSMGDPERYRTKAEVEERRTGDPIRVLAKDLQDNKMADETTLEDIRKSVEEELAEIVRFAEESPEPDDAALCANVYVDDKLPYVEERRR